MKKKFAFTLIEILIAISVFAIGILAVLRVLTWNLSVLDTTNIKLQATVLAKEWIELLYNVRDSNLEKNLSWNCVMKNSMYRSRDLGSNYLEYNDNPEQFICAWKFWVDSLLQLSFDENYYLYQKLSAKSENFVTLFSDNRLCLYKDESKNLSWYAYCSEIEGWEETIFARYLSFSPVYVGDNVGVKAISDSKGNSTQSDVAPSTNMSLSGEKILKVESHVLYDKLGKTWDIVFESFIWNY